MKERKEGRKGEKGNRFGSTLSFYFVLCKVKDGRVDVGVNKKGRCAWYVSTCCETFCFSLLILTLASIDHVTSILCQLNF